MNNRTLILGFVCVFLAAGCSRRERYAGEWYFKCRSNIQDIEGAKAQWELEQRKKNGEPVSVRDISGTRTNFMQKLINKDVVCPAGGIYSPNPVGMRVTCSIPEHNR